MSCVAEEYKIVLGNRTANDEELDAVSDITVEQAVGMIWEGTINLSVNVDEKGIWNIKDKDFSDPQFRARIEVKSKDGSFTPLIDGPVRQSETELRSEPGLSSMKLIINDDSILMNQNKEIHQFIHKKDSDIAEEIYQRVLGLRNDPLNKHQITQTTEPPDTINFRGTSMQLLHMLAARNEMYAYVIPGKEPGKSIGCFNSHQPSVLADLVLLGENRNIESLNVIVDSLKPSIVKNTIINPTKRDTESQFCAPDYSTSELLGDNTVIRNDSHVASNLVRLSQRLAQPSFSLSANNEQMAKAQAKRSGYSIEATGILLETKTYPDILMPYHFIIVRAGNSSHSGRYFITKVSHKITPSSRTQSFTLIRNALSDISKSAKLETIIK